MGACEDLCAGFFLHSDQAIPGQLHVIHIVHLRSREERNDCGSLNTICCKRADRLCGGPNTEKTVYLTNSRMCPHVTNLVSVITSAKNSNFLIIMGTSL
jgi:hypothetical protein